MLVLQCATPHYIQQLQPPKKNTQLQQLQPSFGQRIRSAIHASHQLTSPMCSIVEISATALCVTTGICDSYHHNFFLVYAMN